MGKQGFYFILREFRLLLPGQEPTESDRTGPKHTFRIEGLKESLVVW